MMNLTLNNKVAVVTGAGTGIGAASAQALAAAGAAVALFGLHQDDLENVHEQITAGGGRALVVPGDVAIATDVDAAMRTTAEGWGGIDILFNNAAIMLNKTVVEMTEAEWQRVIAVNLTGVFLGCKYVIPYMQQRGGGAIINWG
jgi:NAD(P)-dependent dehydrogenase (short-subunit alcohol dehydrogenase family)